MDGMMGRKESMLKEITCSVFALKFSNIPSFQHSAAILDSGDNGIQMRVLNLKGRA
jgi:hypothetical protein